jgi:hypothetical protein
MNTAVSYHYTNGSNNHEHATFVLAGELTNAELGVIFAACDEFSAGDFQFIASQVGLPDLADGFGEWELLPGVDHAWCSFDETSFETTSAAPTLLLTAAGLLANFQAVTAWDEEAANERLGLIYESISDEQGV